jgi:glycosyltransferase involved in cell wall biosynthesis
MMSDAVIVLSESERQTLTRLYPGIGALSVIGNSIDSQNNRLTIDPRHDISQTTNVLYVGRFANRKGVHEYFSAIDRILDRFPSTNFTLVGGGSRTDSASDAERWLPARLAHRADRIQFVGWATNVDEYYRQADVLVVPSRYEPFGMVGLEAMYAGIAIAATSIGGPAEILVHEKTGLLFPPQDVSAMAEAICRLIGDPDLRHALGQAAQYDVERRWSWDGAYLRVEACYRQVLAGKCWGAVSPN